LVKSGLADFLERVVFAIVLAVPTKSLEKILHLRKGR
jgi:hypothetical protein